jgi:hypothetical protein
MKINILTEYCLNNNKNNKLCVLLLINIISIAGRFRRAPNFYDRIAAYTGGTVYNIDKNDIAAVLDQVIEVISNSTHSLLSNLSQGSLSSLSLEQFSYSVV